VLFHRDLKLKLTDLEIKTIRGVSIIIYISNYDIERIKSNKATQKPYHLKFIIDL
jgi:hypothetical protein